MRYYITGDLHGEIDRIKNFCTENDTTINDVIIVLGDAGINYWLNGIDKALKEKIADLEITLLCIHGNHEERASLISSYDEVLWNGGVVYKEEEYENILFAKDGEIYNMNDKKCIAIGGAYSIDKHDRLRRGLPWFESEQPSEQIKKDVINKLDDINWKVDFVFSHTVPICFEPQWAFVDSVEQSEIDKTTEIWLQQIYDKLSFEFWYAGHYHVDYEEHDIKIMFEEIEKIEE